MIVAPKLASVVARQIEDQVVELGWPVGELLGSEAELLERFGVSRAVLREAVRIVEHTGAARMRRGPGGGLVVSEPNYDSVSTSISIWFSYVGVTINEIYDVLAPLAIEAARRAIQRQPAVAIVPLRDHMNDMEATCDLGPEAFLDLELRFMALSDNPAIILFANALAGILRSRLRTARAQVVPPLSHDESRSHLAAYRRLADRLAEGDGEGATSQVRRLHDAAQSRLIDGSVEPLREPVAEGTAGAPKLAARVAGVLVEDIERAGWPVDTTLGSELEMIERYEVSRAIFREAVRILEHDGVVRTKRGPRGGLVVDSPDMEAIVRAARLALEHARVTPRQLVDVRIALEVAAVRSAAAKVTPDLAAALHHSVERERDDPGTYSTHLYQLHHEIADASGCRPLALFVRVMSALIDRHLVVDSPGGGRPAKLVLQTHHAHARLVDAVAAGDADLAERRMRRHLNASLTALH